jgi:hypothetical protein
MCACMIPDSLTSDLHCPGPPYKENSGGNQATGVLTPLIHRGYSNSIRKRPVVPCYRFSLGARSLILFSFALASIPRLPTVPNDLVFF